MSFCFFCVLLYATQDHYFPTFARLYLTRNASSRMLLRDFAIMTHTYTHVRSMFPGVMATYLCCCDPREISVWI